MAGKKDRNTTRKEHKEGTLISRNIKQKDVFKKNQASELLPTHSPESSKERRGKHFLVIHFPLPPTYTTFPV